MLVYIRGESVPLLGTSRNHDTANLVQIDCVHSANGHCTSHSLLKKFKIKIAVITCHDETGIVKSLGAMSTVITQSQTKHPVPQ